MWFFRPQLFPHYGELAWSKKYLHDLVLDAIRHLAANSCIKTNFFSSPYSKRADIHSQGCDDVDGFVQELENQLENEPDGKDLTSVNILLQKQSIWETTVMAKTRQIEDLKGQADHLSRISPEKADEFKQTTEQVANKFDTIKGPLEQRRKELEVKKEVFQFMRDVDDENIWMEEKMNLVTSEELGSSLQDVNMLIKKNKTLKGEIENHEPRINTVRDNGQKLIDGGHGQSDEFSR